MWSELHFQRAPAKNCAARFCGKRSCYGATLQVAERLLALSEMNSDAVSYLMPPKRIMWSEIHFHRAPAKNCVARFVGKGAAMERFASCRKAACFKRNEQRRSELPYAAKGDIMWRLITNKEETKYKLYRM